MKHYAKAKAAKSVKQFLAKSISDAAILGVDFHSAKHCSGSSEDF